MSKKKGLSIEEKKGKVLEIFHESKDVYVLKDLEKLAPKRGVVLQSVKEVVQALVDDDLVHQDKIGASNFFWSFPSEAAVKLKTEAKRKEQQLADLEKQDQDLAASIAQSKMGKEDSEDRTAQLGEMEQLQEALGRAQKEVAQYADSDPTRVEAMRVATEIAKSAANRWLDNTWSLESWCKKKFVGMEDSLGNFFKENGLTDDIDYII
ncbi:hypothetical protein CVIRNUC_002788 [Coccomyxa viridis]|uniref:Meiotic nuclear division protein 1 homolog n=1 Tax=Coccomyxa viridis TaxID=1274662 RepID=A0AAV1I137_9CHLO|nr:hypothetical protein CVIRNUC_002788 [Coccomyxa viridis]